jgi:hypothetical protein
MVCISLLHVVIVIVGVGLGAGSKLGISKASMETWTAQW